LTDAIQVKHNKNLTGNILSSSDYFQIKKSNLPALSLLLFLHKISSETQDILSLLYEIAGIDQGS
jgi:hypothetical protein